MSSKWKSLDARIQIAIKSGISYFSLCSDKISLQCDALVHRGREGMVARA